MEIPPGELWLVELTACEFQELYSPVRQPGMKIPIYELVSPSCPFPFPELPGRRLTPETFRGILAATFLFAPGQVLWYCSF